MTGRIVLLNGAPRSGKSSIVAALQTRDDGSWLNLGVDTLMPSLPTRLRPGIGLRPGGERPDLEPDVQRLYRALFASMVAYAEAGFDVVGDLGIHDGYSRPLGILADAVEQLAELPVLLVGVHCPLPVIMARRNADPQAGYYEAGTDVPPPVQRWQEQVHRPGVYDLELNTSVISPAEAADQIIGALANPPSPSAFERLRAVDGSTAT